VPCSRNCVSGVARVPIDDPASLRMVVDGRVADIAATPEPDQRVLLSGAENYNVVNARTGEVAYVGVGNGLAIDGFVDGRLAVLVSESDGALHVDVVDPVTGSVRTHRLSSRSASAVAVGSGGRIAVLSGCCDDNVKITVIEPGGDQHTIDVDDRATSGRGPMMFAHPKLTWSASGLFAMSSSHPFRSYSGVPPPWKGWTAVVDDRGRVVANLDGWQGLAWSPDGLGLLVGHITRPVPTERHFALEVRYGPGLRHRKPVGTAPLPVALVAWTR
jgi:hypothetical protein